MATKSEKLARIHAQAVKEFDDIINTQGDERAQCLADRRFYSIAGAQWEGSLGEQFENKPKFEANKIAPSIMRIVSEYRNNRITVNFTPKPGASDKVADVCNGLYRADEERSTSDESYDNAFEEAVGGGFGAWRLRAEYTDEDDDDNDEQQIIFEPIYDADSCVFFDNNAKRYDKSDARHCFVLTSMTIDQYIDEYGDDPESWDRSITQTEFDWATSDLVYVAEYYKVEQVKETIHIYKTLDGEDERYNQKDFENDSELELTILMQGSVKTGEKQVKRKKVHKYILSGGCVLEDCGYIAGNVIPVVPVYGKRWFVDGIERCRGHVRLAKDMQRLKNMQLSKLGEISALSSVEKPILTPEQISGHEQIWAKDNIENYPYLTLNPIIDDSGNVAATGPMSYTKPPAIPPAMAALLQITEADMQDLLGSQQAGEEIVSNISGKAVELIQAKLDMQTYIYMSNMAKSIKRSGEIWLAMAKDLLIEPGRKMKTLDAHGEASSVELGKTTLNPDTGEIECENDIACAKLDVSVTVGPSSASKRQATVRSIMGMMQVTQDPDTLNVLSSMAVMNMDGEGVAEVRDYFRIKLIKLGVIKPTAQEAEMLAQQQNRPDANTVYLQAAADAETARAAKARADTVLTVAKAEETRAKTAETMSNIDYKGQQAAIELARELTNG